MKINIIGCTGSGKTTLCKLIGSRLSISQADLDELVWSPNWVLRPKSEALADLTDVLTEDCWVISGDYSAYRSVIMGAADYILWLDFPFWTNFSRLFKRTLRRVFLRERCCNGNYESLGQVCFSKYSIIYWFFKTFWKVRKRNTELILRESQLGNKVIRLQSDDEVRNFVNLISTSKVL